MENNIDKKAYDDAAKRVKEIKAFYIHLTCYCIFTPVIIFVNLTFSPEYYWFLFSVIGWGCGILIHGLVVFALSSNWEKRKIRELMEQEKNNNWK